MRVHVEVEFTRPRLGRPQRRRLALAGLVAALLVPGLALASHTFTDVPTSHTFHTNIARLYGARITGGCGGGKYCPEDPVTRGQMAAFLGRTGGRGAGDDFPIAVSLTNTNQILGQVTIKAGDITGGTAYVKIDAQVQAFTASATGCPCAGALYIYEGATGIVGPAYVSVNVLGDNGYSLDGGAISAMVAVPTGVSTTFTVRARQVSGTGGLMAFGTMTGLYVPFAAAGGNPALPVGGAAQPGGGSPVPGG